MYIYIYIFIIVEIHAWSVGNVSWFTPAAISLKPCLHIWVVCDVLYPDMYIYIYIHMKSVMHNDTQTHIFVSPSLHRSVCLPIYLSIYLQIPPNIPIATLGSNSKEQTPLIGRTESCNSAYHWVHGIYILCILGGWNFEGLLGGLENLCACCANLAGWNW